MRFRCSVLAALCAAALAACGSTRHVTVTVTHSATSAPSTASTSTDSSSSSRTAATTSSSSGSASASSETSRSPRRILADAASALARSDGYLMRAQLHQRRRETRIAVSVDSVQSVQLTLTMGAALSQVIGIHGGASYLRGNQAFWRSSGGAAGLAGRWLRVPTGGKAIRRTLGSIAPAVIGRCLQEDHGTLTLAGRVQVAGRAALLIRDAGNAPGAGRGSIAVAADGPPYPLRIVAAGLPRPGGHVDVCNSGRTSDSETGTITFGQFGHVPAIQAPSGAQALPNGPSV